LWGTCSLNFNRWESAIASQIFGEYVFGFIYSDIQREITLAKRKEGYLWQGPGPDQEPGGGNLLAALGLVCYTEFLGSFMTNHTKGSSRKNFEIFFSELGPCYQAFAKAHPAYDLFRNGLVHEYLVKKACDIYMVVGDETCGVGEIDGRFYFVVERYFNDFKAAAQRIYEKLLRDPMIPARPTTAP
jgi:hypothetical protein